ncbi:MAG: hypothetical protein JNJ78_25640, partial [Anaerolineae bacterium]|nr:hypothetical protein [Anaerolineae bacterium]
ATPKSSGGDKAGGGVLGGLTSRFGGGKSDNKPATPKSSGGDKGSGGGMFGGITSRFGGGKTDDKKPAAPSGSSSSPYGARPGSSTSTSSSSGFGGGAKPGASSGGDAGKSGGLFSKSPFGKLGGNNPTGTTAKPSTPAKSGEQRSGLGRLFPFLGGGSASKPADKKARQSKAPHVEGGGLTLDNKLDILGVALVLSSLALIFSRLSTTRGALTE